MIYIFMILALVMLYMVVRIARDIFRSYQCVDERTLRQFLYGRLSRDSERYRNVVAHLGQCHRCQELLRELQRGKRLEDHLVDGRRGGEGVRG